MNPASEVARLLKEHNAVLQRDRKHEVWRFPNGKAVTLSKTPSDFRAAANKLTEVRRCLGLGDGRGQPGGRRERKVKHERPTLAFEAATAPNMALRDALIAAGCEDADQLIARMDMATIGEILLSKGNVQAVTDLAAIKQQAPVQNNNHAPKVPLRPPLAAESPAPALPAPAGYRKQKCEDCGEEKVITEFQRLRNGEHSKICKVCHEEVAGRARSEKAETKACSRCGERKPRAEFHRRSASKDGLNAGCKACVQKYDAIRSPCRRKVVAPALSPAKGLSLWSRIWAWLRDERTA